MKITGPGFLLRPWRKGDEDALVRYADNPRIARNLMDTFPHPYTRADADTWITSCLAGNSAEEAFAIEIGGEAAGGVGGGPMKDVRGHARLLGYWLAEPFWGKGIATTVVARYIEHVFTVYSPHRLQTFVYAWNPASARVLEKNGFQLEGRLRQNICKFGEYTDELVYGLLRAEWERHREGERGRE